MDQISQIAPFSWIALDDGIASVTLYTRERYKEEMFKTRKDEGFSGSGYDWESLAMQFIQENVPDLQQVISFDSEHLMFCAYSSDEDALKRFIFMFKEACENDAAITDIFSRTAPDEPITMEDIQSVLAKLMGTDTE